MSIYVYGQAEEHARLYDFTITQAGKLDPTPPDRFHEWEELTVLLEDGAQVPSDRQMVALTELLHRFIPTVFYAFPPSENIIHKHLRRKWYTDASI